MELIFLSSDSWRPENAESDTVSLALRGNANEPYTMVDTGWHPVHNLLRENIPVEQVRHLLFTHLHQDHRMGLPAILFYLLNSHHDAGTLSIYGIEGTKAIVDMALEYAGKNISYVSAPAPAVRQIIPGDHLFLSGLRVETAPSHHAVPGIMFRFTDEAGHRIVYSGDTAPSEDTIAFAKDADVLIHEHSYGATRPDGENRSGHSSAEDAAIIARSAGAGKLYLVHGIPAAAEESLSHARKIFENTYRAKAGGRIEL